MFRTGSRAGLSEMTVATGRRSLQAEGLWARTFYSGTRPLHWSDRQEDGEGWEGAEDGATVPAGPGPRGQASVEPGCGFGRSPLAWEGSLRGAVPGSTLPGPPVLQEAQPAHATVLGAPPSGRFGDSRRGPRRGRLTFAAAAPRPAPPNILPGPELY